MTSPSHVRNAVAALAALVLGLLPLTVAAQSVVVQPGDTLSRIARRHNTSVSALVQANRLAAPDLIYPGQQLAVPGARPAPERRAVAVPRIHVVQPGETLFHISARYGTTVGDVAAANQLTSVHRIYPGQRLALPGAAGIGQAEIPPSPLPASGERHIVVSLAHQSLVAYEGNQAVATFPISSGKSWTPTPVGRFRIYLRYPSQRMSGPGYDLPGVPYVQYFLGNYAVHGAYWHDNFGTPTSHGCVNMRIADAAWLWAWSALGTEVVVQE